MSPKLAKSYKETCFVDSTYHFLQLLAVVASYAKLLSLAIPDLTVLSKDRDASVHSIDQHGHVQIADPLRAPERPRSSGRTLALSANTAPRTRAGRI